MIGELTGLVLGTLGASGILRGGRVGGLGGLDGWGLGG